jgi:hypothetical protein
MGFDFKGALAEARANNDEEGLVSYLQSINYKDFKYEEALRDGGDAEGILGYLEQSYIQPKEEYIPVKEGQEIPLASEVPTHNQKLDMDTPDYGESGYEYREAEIPIASEGQTTMYGDEFKQRQFEDAKASANFDEFGNTYMIDPNTKEEVLVHDITKSEGAMEDMSDLFFMGPIGGSVKAARGVKVIEPSGLHVPSDVEGLTTGAKLMVDRMNRKKETISYNEAKELLKDVPVQDQALALAMRTDDEKFIGVVKKAIGEDNTLRSMLQDEAVMRADTVKVLSQSRDDLKLVQKEWSDMLTTLAESKVSLSTSEFGDSVAKLNSIYGLTNPKASKLINKIHSENVESINLVDAVEVRKGLNDLLDKTTKGSSDYIELDKVKTKLDNFISTQAPEQSDLIESVTSKYKDTINNVKIGTLLKKNSKQGAVKWGKFLDDMKKNNVHSGNTKMAVENAKYFVDKYKLDGKLDLSGKGSTEHGTGYLGVVSAIIGNTVDILWTPMFNRSRYKDLKIQKEIRKTIRESKSVEEFVTKMKKSNMEAVESRNLGETIDKAFNVVNTDGNAKSINFNGKEAILTLNKDAIKFDNQNFSNTARGEGSEFYKKLFDLGNSVGKNIKPDGQLLGHASYRYPIAAMKYAEAGGDTTKIFIGDKPINIRAQANAILAEYNRDTKYNGETMRLSEENIAMLKRLAK